MINYQECLQHYRKILDISDEHFTHHIVMWYQDKCRFYEDETCLLTKGLIGYEKINWEISHINKDVINKFRIT